ncbi:hypothetical protein Tco_0072382, partial [Tanacetum coccineum]
LAISPYFFALILDELSRGIQESIPWCLIFADDIVLVSDTPDGLNGRLEQWREMLENKGLRDGGRRNEDVKVDLWRPQSAHVRRVETIVVDGVRRRGRPKLKWEDTLKTDLKELLLSEDMTSDRNSWRTGIRVDELYVGMLVLYMPSFSSLLMWSFWVHALLPEVFLEAIPLSLGRGVTVYIPPPPYLALARLGTVVVVVVSDKCGDRLVPTPGGILRRLEAFFASPIGCGGSDVGIA